jgi:hypothetical protein
VDSFASAPVQTIGKMNGVHLCNLDVGSDVDSIGLLRNGVNDFPDTLAQIIITPDIPPPL